MSNDVVGLKNAADLLCITKYQLEHLLRLGYLLDTIKKFGKRTTIVFDRDKLINAMWNK